MPVLEESLGDDDYAGLNWIDLVGDEGDGSECWTLAAKFFEASRAFVEQGLHPQAKALKVLGGAVSMHLRHPSHMPFGPMYRDSDGRSMSMEDLGVHDVALLARAASDAQTAWLRARFADLAVTASGETPPNWRAGRMAADAYIDYVESVFGTEDAIRALDDLRRGLVLMRVYAKKDSALSARYWSAVLNEVPHSIENDWPGLAFRLCDEAIERNREVCEAMLPQFEAKARSLDGSNPQEAARWHAQTHRLNQRLGRTADADASLIAQGEAMSRAADLAAMHQPLIAPAFLVEAISLLRKTRAPMERVGELKDRLQTLERASLDHFGHFSTEIDVGDLVAWIDQQIAASDFFSTLLRASYRAGRWLNAQEIEARVKLQATENFFSSMLASTHANREGTIVSRLPPLNPNDPVSVRKHAVRSARQIDVPMRSSVMVLRVARTIYTNHQPSFDAIKEIVEASPITPPGQVETLSRGLFYGLIDDWLAASVFLIPAVEPFIRFQLKRVGAHTTGMNDDGTQHEKTLGELLELPEASSFLGNELQFELQVLLTDSEGFNLRNAYCHGLLADDDLQNVATISLWWILWRMILIPWSNHPALLAPPEASND